MLRHVQMACMERVVDPELIDLERTCTRVEYDGRSVCAQKREPGSKFQLRASYL
jgi:hypothetical protein